MMKTLVLGGGFAAIAAVERLSEGSLNGNEVTLVSAGRNFIFYPALVPMVFGNVQPEDLSFDLRKVMAARGIRFAAGRVSGIGTASRTVLTAGDGSTQSYEFDHLIVALGRRVDLHAIKGLGEHSHHLLSIESALRFRDAIKRFRAGNIVVGMCAGSTLPVPVCESALALAKRFKSEIAAGKVSVTAIFPQSIDDAFAGSTLFRDIEGAMKREGIRIVSDLIINRVTDTFVYGSDGEEVAHDLLMLMPPFSGQSQLFHPGVRTDAAGFISVNNLMQVEGCEHIYAAGDCIALNGPKFGYMAIRQGRTAAENVLSELRGKPPRSSYRHVVEWALGERYTDPIYFHYGLWDDTLRDSDRDALFGMTKALRDIYGGIKPDGVTAL